MMTLIQKFLSMISILGSFSALASVPNVANLDWKEDSDRNGIQVLAADIAGSSVFAYQAHAEIDAPLPKVASILIDTPHMKDWMPDLGEARDVKMLSPTERIQYLHVKTPFVISDRDFVVQGKATYDREKQELKLVFWSVDSKEMPPVKGLVRGKIHTSEYILKPGSEKGRTDVRMVVHVDPMGTVPKWIVNIFQRGYPRQVLDSLRDRAMDPEISTFQGVQEIYEGKRDISKGLSNT